MESAVLELLCCPVTRQSLRMAEASQLAAIPRNPPLEGGLIRDDGKVLYPVVNGIPLLLAEEGIPL